VIAQHYHTTLSAIAQHYHTTLSAFAQRVAVIAQHLQVHARPHRLPLIDHHHFLVFWDQKLQAVATQQEKLFAHDTAQHFQLGPQVQQERFVVV